MATSIATSIAHAAVVVVTNGGYIVTNGSSTCQYWQLLCNKVSLL